MPRTALTHKRLGGCVQVPIADASVALDVLGAQCDTCNERKMASKAAQDRSDRVYLCLYLSKNPTEADAVVCDVGGASYFTIIMPEWDLEARVFLDRCGWTGTFDEEKRELMLHARRGDAPTPGRAPSTPAQPASKRKAREMAKWAVRNPEQAAVLRSKAGRDGDLLRAAESMLEDDASTLSAAATPATPASDASSGSVGIAGAAIVLPTRSQADAACVLPAGGFVIRCMSRLRVRLVAVMDRVPIEYDVQVLALLP